MVHVDPQLKEHIIQQYIRDGRTLQSLIDEYGYSRDVIGLWRRAYRKSCLGDI